LENFGLSLQHTLDTFNVIGDKMELIIKGLFSTKFRWKVAWFG